MLNATEQQLAPDGRPFTLTTLRNAGGMTVTLMDWGATWLSARLPLGDGEMREVLLGCATPADYLRQSAYLGATVAATPTASPMPACRWTTVRRRCWPIRGRTSCTAGRRDSTPAAGASPSRIGSR
ncbi:Aldose 1-epimerase [Serratia rubidaea]|uniref:Aldose 1-epimerase n=1 Tax=Serratia rubidaea TaxID=61652 RepID=A0A4U9HBJ9_SERRU|nr:Aldose 1-epimerase [Serratia rubidaea]